MLRSSRYLLLVFLLATIIGCSSGGGDNETPVKPEQPEKPTKDNTEVEKHDSLTEDARPSWAVVANVDPTVSSMTLTFVLSDVVVKGDYNTTWTFQPDKSDLVASFINGECRGLTSPMLYDKYFAFLPVAATENEDPYAQPSVVVKYYSSRMKHIFTAKDNIIFTQGGSQGSPSNPLKLTWEK